MNEANYIQKHNTVVVSKNDSFCVPLHTAIKELAAHLAVPVDISTSGNSKGKITIPFRSKEEFKRLINRITGE